MCCVYRIWCLILLVALTSLCLPALPSAVWKLNFDDQSLGNGPASYYAGSSNEIVPVSLARMDGNGIPQIQTSTGPQGGRMLALTPSTLSTWASQSGYYANGSAGNIGGDGSFTVESLVKLTAYPVSPNNVMQLASNDLMGDGVQMTVDLSIRYNGQVNAFYRIPGMATNPNLNTLGVYALPLNTWTHLACVYIPDPTPGETISTSKGWVGLYVNGVLMLDSSFEGPVGVTTLPLNRWGFGMWGKSTVDANRTINGYLDGIAVSNTALSPAAFVLQQFPASTVWKLTFDNHPTGNGPAAYYASSANEAVPISLARLDGNGIPQVQTSTGPQGGGMLALTPSTLSTWASQSGYYVNGPAGNIGGNGSFTVESLVKLTAYPVSPNNVMQLASNDLMGDNGQMTVDLSIRYNGQVNAFYRIPGMATNPNLNTLGVYALPLNTWTHLACVYIPDPTPGETTSTSKGWVGLYVNGVLTLDSSFEGPVGSVTTLPLNRWGFGMWGKSTTDANRTINGYLDGVAVSNSALSPSRFVLQQFTPNIANFPVQQKNYTIALGGNVRGFGMLAQFAAPGAKEIYVSRTTTVPTNPPDAFPPVALARVFDPNGDLVALYDFSDQPTGTTTTTLPVPAFATTGIWRVSFSGGRKNDTLEIRLPQTDIWGVRGEMPLGISDTLPSDMYVYLPRTVTKIYCETFGGQTPDIELYDQNNVSLGKPTYNASSGRNLLTLTTLTPGTVYRLRQGVIDNAGYGMAFDGVPGLLCPSVAAANALQGGAIDNCDGLLVAGPLQRRARAWMYARRNDNFSFSFAQQSSQSAVDNVQLEVLPYGKYGALPSLESALGAQNLTASSPFFGAINVPATPTDWQSFLHGAQLSLFDASGLLGLYVTPGTWNFGYQNDALRKRAMLSAQYHLVSMQADDLLREGDFTVNSYPLSSVFFVYDAELAKPYLLLKTYYQTHTADSTWTTVEPIWRQGLLAVGDKLGDYTSYESNQWMHVLMGHLETYLATGEPRFRTYFERQLTAFLDGAYGTAAKFGQHPDGYYLEEYGP
ncbi:MAG TPA: LamG-like jellyroll fold domain-containing protein, partial [Armatimonadota bacterium]